MECKEISELPDNLLIGGFLPKAKFNEIIALAGFNSILLWSSSRSDVTAFVCLRGNCHAKVENPRYLIISLGHISGCKQIGENALREIEHYLLRRSNLPLSSFEGSFALIVVDKANSKMMIYRNIVGLPCIYYISAKKLTLFSDNISCLARLVNTICPRLEVNHTQVPCHFLYGVTLRETLFKDIRRVMVGEQVVLTPQTSSRTQLLKISDMANSSITDCVESLESVMKEITAEYVKAYPDLVNMFSGGIDSSYIQAHLGSSIRTFSVDLVHPCWEAEHEYARSGSAFFKTDHTFVKVTESQYPGLLTETISKAGLPPRNPNRALCYHLFKSIKEASRTVVCGMGGDCLFGLGLIREIDAATLIDSIIPWKFFRQPLLSLLRSLYVRTNAHPLGLLIKVLQLELHDFLSPKHPAHMAGIDYVRLKGVSEVFGHEEVARAVSSRQALTRLLGINGSLKQVVHSMALTITCPQAISEQYFQLASHVGLNILHPYLDSRMIKVVSSFRGDKRFPFGRVKSVIKHALRKHVPKKLVRRKSGWELPVFEWMAEGGVLHPFVKDLKRSQFAGSTRDLIKMPNNLMWDLITFHLWLKQFNLTECP